MDMGIVKRNALTTIPGATEAWRRVLQTDSVSIEADQVHLWLRQVGVAVAE